MAAGDRDRVLVDVYRHADAQLLAGNGRAETHRRRHGRRVRRVVDVRIIVRVEVCILARSFVSAFRERSDGDIDQKGPLISSKDCILYNQHQGVCLRLFGADL